MNKDQTITELRKEIVELNLINEILTKNIEKRYNKLWEQNKSLKEKIARIKETFLLNFVNTINGAQLLTIRSILEELDAHNHDTAQSGESSKGNEATITRGAETTPQAPHSSHADAKGDRGGWQPDRNSPKTKPTELSICNSSQVLHETSNICKCGHYEFNHSNYSNHCYYSKCACREFQPKEGK